MATLNNIPMKNYKELGDEEFPGLIEREIGPGAKLLSWDSKYFTKLGDNFMGKVKHVTGKAYYEECVVDLDYIVKLNPRRKIKVFEMMTNGFFVKEAKFLTEIAPELSEILTAAGLQPLRVPRCPFVNLEKNNEIILLNDLRLLDYKLANRLEPLNLPHITLFMNEIARQHAASYILHLQHGTDLSILFPYLEESWLHEKNPGASQYIQYCKVRFEAAFNALENIPEYDKVLTWLKKEEDNLLKYLVESWEQSDEKFRVICHGDCWTNNLMFRYDTSGTPINIMLIDYQQCRVASLLTDIHLFLINTTSGKTRQRYIVQILNTYFMAFCEVFHGSEEKVPFTFEELITEYTNKTLFGFLAGMIKLPLLLAEDKATIDLDALNEADIPIYLEKQKWQLTDMIATSEEKRKRFLSVFDDAINIGFFD